MNRIVTPVPADYNAVKDMVYALAGKYTFLKLSSIGKSVRSRDLFALEIGRKSDKVLYAAAFHGQEWMTSLLLLAFLEDICEAYRTGSSLSEIDVRRALFGSGLIIVPLMNPDGVDIAIHGVAGAPEKAAFLHGITHGDYSSWNANANGVDLNHNFDAGWKTLRRMEIEDGIYGPSPRRYGGPCPESEPESRAIADLCRRRFIRHALAFHSQGEEIYWDYNGYAPPRSSKMTEVMALSSGYAVSAPEGLASHGGFKDWFLQEFRRPAFTIEIGKGKNPLPLSDFPDIYARLQEMLLLAAVM